MLLNVMVAELFIVLTEVEISVVVAENAATEAGRIESVLVSSHLKLTSAISKPGSTLRMQSIAMVLYGDTPSTPLNVGETVRAAAFKQFYVNAQKFQCPK